MKPIFTALSPNLQADDVRLALKRLWMPWQWRRGPAIQLLEERFNQLFSPGRSLSFAAGRSALYAVLRALDLQPGDEVCLQAFTCVAVPDPVLWVKATPVYVDCEEATLGMSPRDFEKKITPRTKAVIIQHTFGRAARINELVAIARKKNIFVIEDCAHALGGEYQGRLLGTFGDAAFFSFGRDKVISSVFGGMLVVHDARVFAAVKTLHSRLPYPGLVWIKQQLLHPLITFASKQAFNFFSVGRMILAFSRQLRLIAPPVYPQEKRGGLPPFASARLPNALAALALRQLDKLATFNAHRERIATLYAEALGDLAPPPPRPDAERSVWLRYPVRVKYQQQTLLTAKNLGLYLGDWYDVCIAPRGVDLRALQYQTGTCPVAERLALNIINLPTDIHVTEADAKRIIQFFQTYDA